MRAVGRADLVALLDVPAVGARRAARLLGFEPPTEPVHEERPRAAPPPAEVPQSFPVIAAAPLAPMPYWKAASLVLHPPPRRAPDRGPGVSAKELASSGAWVHSAPPPPPLTPWSRVWPRLQAPLRTSVPGRVPDLARMVRRMACGLPVQRIPMRPRRRWTSRLSVWIDTSARLAPFAADQEDVVARLRRSIGTEAVRVRWLTRAVQARSVEQTGDLLTGYKVDALTPILVLGDLGTYAPDERARAAWSETARRLGHAGVRLTALVPAPRLRWAPGIAHDWQAMQWGEAAVTGPTAPEADKELRARAERLLQVASLAAYVHPGLLRTLRRLWPRDQSDPGDRGRRVDARRRGVWRDRPGGAARSRGPAAGGVRGRRDGRRAVARADPRGDPPGARAFPGRAAPRRDAGQARDRGAPGERVSRAARGDRVRAPAGAQRPAWRPGAGRGAPLRAARGSVVAPGRVRGAERRGPGAGVRGVLCGHRGRAGARGYRPPRCCARCSLGSIPRGRAS
jgi:hypothetical protein